MESNFTWKSLAKHGPFSNLCKSKLMKGKALGKHSLHEETAASVLLKVHTNVQWKSRGWWRADLFDAGLDRKITLF